MTIHPDASVDECMEEISALEADNERLRTEIEAFKRPWYPGPGDMAVENMRLRAGIQAFLDGDWEPKVRKIEKCPHGQYGYESCEACIEIWFQRLLEQKP